MLAADAVDDFSLPVALAERALQINPQNVSYLNTLGAVFYRAGRYDEAAEQRSWKSLQEFLAVSFN